MKKNDKNEELLKNEIINLIKKKKYCSFGDIVKELARSSLKVMYYVNELKREGKITNSKKSPYFSLADS